MKHLWLVLALLTIAGIGTGLSFLTFRHLVAHAQTTQSGVDLIMIPSKPAIMPGDPVDIAIWVYPNGNQVTAAELRVNFDPAILTPLAADPFVPGTDLKLVLPNCSAGSTTPCPSVGNVTGSQALIYLAVDCTETGCTIPNSENRFLLATLKLQATAAAAGQTSLSLRSNIPGTTVNPTMVAALAFDNDAANVISSSGLSFTACSLPYDFAPNGQVDIVDVMQAANRWNTAAGNAEYDGQYDLDQGGAIDIADIQTVAAHWNETCQAN